MSFKWNRLRFELLEIKVINNWQSRVCLLSPAHLSLCLRSRKIERSTRWRCYRRRGESHQPSSVAGAPAALPMPSLTPVVMLTSFRPGEAFGGGRQSVLDLRTASGRSLTERQKTSERGCTNGAELSESLIISGWSTWFILIIILIIIHGVSVEMLNIRGLRTETTAWSSLVYLSASDDEKPFPIAPPLCKDFLLINQVGEKKKKKAHRRHNRQHWGFEVMQWLCDWQCCLTQDFKNLKVSFLVILPQLATSVAVTLLNGMIFDIHSFSPIDCLHFFK